MRRDLLGATKAIAAAAIVTFASGCSRKPEPPVATVPKAVASASATAIGAAADATNAQTVHGLRKQKNLDVPVFVDGAEVSVLRFGELPPGITPVAKPASEDPNQRPRFYRISDYLRAIGVNVERVKAIHFADKGLRIASIEGSELRADKDRFVFDFLETTTGMPMQSWKTTGLKNLLKIDDIMGMNVFVEKTPMTIDKGLRCYVDDGECMPVARFASGDLMKGTRVYSDGKLVGYVKRRLLADSTLAGKTASGETTFSFEKYLASLGIKSANAKEIRILAGDDVVASATAKEWAADEAKLSFYLVPHAHGKVRGTIPADLQKGQSGATDRDVQVTAIQVFTHKEPRSVPVVAVDDAFDPGPNVAALEAALAQAGPGTRDSE
jgi:hypothetical protein